VSQSKPIDGAPERFVPGEMRGQLVEAEHLARYWFAQSLASGRRVLDAGCGTGYGTQMIADSGATSTVGVDISEAALGAAAERIDEHVGLKQGDLCDLPFAAASFDLVVCFEAIEHVVDPERALDELRRVLSGTGILLISSPNRREYPAGNPHHVHEYVPEELEETLGRRFGNVELRRQQAWTASLIQDDTTFATDILTALDIELAKVVARRPGDETYTIALASDVDLPVPKGVGVITAAEEVNRWLALFDEQHERLTDQAELLSGHAENDEERKLLHERLRELERDLHRLPGLERGLYDERRDRLDAERRLAELEESLNAETERAERAERVQREVKASVSWRITAPLRALKR